ncbi:MAG: hypothetical protein P1U58_01505 [Verrucomicrobiales bacterium]|nr:hypothetical protein [Verrucomicrobiales bacterium]
MKTRNYLVVSASPQLSVPLLIKELERDVGAMQRGGFVYISGEAVEETTDDESGARLLPMNDRLPKMFGNLEAVFLIGSGQIGERFETQLDENVPLVRLSEGALKPGCLLDAIGPTPGRARPRLGQVKTAA